MNRNDCFEITTWLVIEFHRIFETPISVAVNFR